MKQKKHKSLLHSSSLYILLMFAILLTGCGSKGEEQGETQSDVQAEEQTEPSAAEFLKEDGTADIQALQAINAEAYAWLEITGTDISFPILQPAEDEYFYLSHNIYGDEDENGCIYTEYYNNQDFGDPNTEIYGRSRLQPMISGIKRFIPHIWRIFLQSGRWTLL